MGLMRADRRKRFWDHVCGLLYVIRAGFALVVVLFVLSIFSLLFVERGTMSYVTLLLNFSILIPMLVSLVLVIWRCESHLE
ncbi:hypothetical protein OB955_15335 [Halobacteria archaeon AArc-m2/3/4]|uniref:Uncharacterized protein n=1 Tax=Natronoglomus mannanivorans TaxID=2979990 RepID=A0AAP2Z2F8_9EURY|nr:hypothetical protein [Halobacteria archaeon AArc-xg1-1]MCU4974102.1 hypothetical protein [Halobacteria archaeon AArc-m2/3/4]